jgi:hypothetical protein
MNRPIDLMAEVGMLLYGDHWKQPLAEDLAVNAETIRKWMTGRRILPADSPVLIRCLVLLDIELLRLKSETAKVNELRAKFARVTPEPSPVN